jgi:hypothetical protein
MTPKEKQVRLDNAHVAFQSAVLEIGHTDYALDINKGQIRYLDEDEANLVKLLPPLGGAAARAKWKRPHFPVTLSLHGRELTLNDYQALDDELHRIHAQYETLITTRNALNDAIKAAWTRRRGAANEISFITLKMLEQGDLPFPSQALTPLQKALNTRNK